MSNNSPSSYLNNLVEIIKGIDTTDLSDTVDQNAYSKVTEEQKVYFWIRVYLKDENLNIEIGDDVSINYTPSGESLITKFICYGKKGFNKDSETIDNVTNYNPDDDKKCICLMIDTKMVNFSNDIPFIRTLFKTGYHYEYQLVKREELQLIVNRNGIILDYFDIDF